MYSEFEAKVLNGLDQVLEDNDFVLDDCDIYENFVRRLNLGYTLGKISFVCLWDGIAKVNHAHTPYCSQFVRE